MRRKRSSARRGAVLLLGGLSVTAVCVAIVLGMASGSGGTAGPTRTRPAAPAAPVAPVVTTPATIAPDPTDAPVTYPEVGPHTYAVAAGTGPILGHGGELLRYRVAVEDGIGGLDAARFAGIVEQVYGDARGWTAGDRWRLQRVGPDQPADFVVYLVTPATRDVLCQDGYDRYTSCRNGDRVVLNVARYVHGVPHYGAPQSVYQAYMINHETGHRLYFGHELCPGPGQPAPVMQQQTLGLHGCVANAWPYLNGRSYHGVSGNYDEP